MPHFFRPVRTDETVKRWNGKTVKEINYVGKLRNNSQTAYSSFTKFCTQIYTSNYYAYILHLYFIFYILHFIFYILCFIFYILYFIFHTLYFIFYILYFVFCNLSFIFYIFYFSLTLVTNDILMEVLFVMLRSLWTFFVLVHCLT